MTFDDVVEEQTDNDDQNMIDLDDICDFDF